MAATEECKRGGVDRRDRRELVAVRCVQWILNNPACGALKLLACAWGEAGGDDAARERGAAKATEARR